MPQQSALGSNCGGEGMVATWPSQRLDKPLDGSVRLGEGRVVPFEADLAGDGCLAGEGPDGVGSDVGRVEPGESLNVDERTLTRSPGVGLYPMHCSAFRSAVRATSLVRAAACSSRP